METKVSFYAPSEIEDELIKFAVIAARYKDKWVFCRHKKRTTWEIPGGHREQGEEIGEAARRELWEETGAADAEISAVSAYTVENNEGTGYGMLFFADIKKFEPIPSFSEIGETVLAETPPDNLTYPDIQPHLFGYIQNWLN